MSSNPFLWTGYLTGETPSSAGIPAAGRSTSYASIAATRSHNSTRAGAVSALLNPSPPPRIEEDYLALQRNRFPEMRDQYSDVMDSSFPGAAQSSRPASAWQPKSPVFDQRSRIFEAFMSRDQLLSDATNPLLYASGPRRIAPSYLQGTEYMKKLDEQHKRRIQAFREGHTQSHNGGLASSSSSHSLHASKLPPPSHRGMTLDVIEKTPSSPSLEAKENVSPLPSGWNKDDKHNGLEVAGDGCEVKYTGPRSSTEKDHEACAIRADHHIPGQCGVYYFEITVLNTKREDTTIIIGFAGKDVSLSRAPGWEPESWGYHGDDGNLFAAQSTGKPYGPTFGQGDTVGCLVNFRTATASFTKNGQDLGVAFRDNTFRQGKGKLFPIVGLKKPGDHIIANFGQLPFQFDIDGYVRAEKKKIWDKIRQTETRNLVPGLSETELCQQLVLQHLQHDGYVETARAFAEEIVAEKKRLQLDPKEPVKGINIKDDEDARQRQEIRRAVLEGDIDHALKFTNTWYPKVLKAHGEVYFRLRCRKFIEMIRKDAEQNLKRDNPGAVPVTKTVQPHPKTEDVEMDFGPDGNGYDTNQWDERMEDDQPSGYTPPAVGKLLEEALAYGKELRAEFAEATDPEVPKHLDEIFALIAYQNPLMEESVVHLLDRSGRVAVAEELNSAILLSLGKQSRSALETMYADTVVLLESLRQDDSGDGAFVSIQDVLDRIPKPAMRT